jgi:hypothetical protein
VVIGKTPELFCVDTVHWPRMITELEDEMKSNLASQVSVAHAYNPSYLGG